MSKPLTAGDIVALRRAVRAYADIVIAMPGVDGVTQEQIDVERERLDVANRALRKVNELRKQGL